jgi:hypothetical protein
MIFVTKMISITLQKLRKLPRLLIAIFCVLLIFNILTIIITHYTSHTTVYGFINLFNFDSESNLPTYFSSTNLLIAAVLLYSIFYAEKMKNSANKKYWLVLSLVLFCLSVDEAASLHELLMRPMQEILESKSIDSRWLFYPWVIPGIIIVLVMAAFFLKFYLRLPIRYKVLFGISAVLLIGGAIGMEVINSFIVHAVDFEGSLTYCILMTLEESMEMTGVIVFIYALIEYMQSVKIESVITD